jgi:predicted SAM-dependent methyltransferase
MWRTKLSTEALRLLESEVELKLDLGCGGSPREGFEGVDLLAPEAKHKVNLFKFPFPWEDDSVSELHCSHFLEHLPAREVEERDMSCDVEWNREVFSRIVGQDFLFAFMDECWRVLRNGAKMTVLVPSARSDRAFQDPTHRRFFNERTFGYFSKTWRNGEPSVRNYRVRCDFESHVIPIVETSFTMRCTPAQKRMLTECWNIALDFQAILTCRKTGEK